MARAPYPLRVLFLLFSGAVIAADAEEFNDEASLLQTGPALVLREQRRQASAAPAHPLGMDPARGAFLQQSALLQQGVVTTTATLGSEAMGVMWQSLRNHVVGRPVTVADDWASVQFRCHRLYLWDSYILLCFIIFDGAALILLYLVMSWKTTRRSLFEPKFGAYKNVILGSLGVFVLLMSAFIVSLLVVCRFGQRGHLEFVHIPKCAGSSVEVAGLTQGIAWSRRSLSLLGGHTMPDGNNCNRYHVPPSMLQWSPYHRNTLFCITRHPFSRAVSEYRYLLDTDIQDWGRRFAETFDNGLYEYKPCTKAGLNFFIQRTAELYKQGQKYIDDCHHIPQSEYIWDFSSGSPGRSTCAEVLRIEDIPFAFNSLMQKYGYQGVRLLQRKSFSSVDYCNITTDDLTAESKQVLREIYANDFRLLNYSAD